MQIVFRDAELGFVASLARWIEPPAPAAKDAQGDAEAVTPSAFEADCVALEGKGDLKGLSEKLRAALLGRVAGGAPGDIQSAYAILFELLAQWKLLSIQAEALAGEIAGSSPAQQPEDEQRLRCALMLSLYGLVHQHGDLALHFCLLLRLIHFCHSIGELSKVLGAPEERVDRVDRWVSEWDLSETQQKNIWGAVFDAHAADSRVSYDCALKYFSLHRADDLASQPELHKRIVQGLLITIRSPELVRLRSCHSLPQPCILAHASQSSSFARTFACTLRCCACLTHV
jgi:hypothetical protein